MERRDRRINGIVSAAAVLLLAAPFAAAQIAPAGSGHWEGTIQLPKKVLKVAVDLAQDVKGEWTGSLEIPEARLSNVVASEVVVREALVRFEARDSLLGFEGELSADGKSLKGGFLSGCLLTVPVPIELRRVSAARVKKQPGSTAISKDLEGSWEGIVTLGSAWEDGNPSAGSALVVRVKMANDPGGVAAGTLAKTGAPEGDVPLSTISQQGSGVRFELKSAGIVAVGERKGDELVGEWSQFGLDPVPLRLKRAQKN